MATKTFSKAYGLLGLGSGYLLADKDVIDLIAPTLIPWNVGTIPMWAVLAALNDEESMRNKVVFNNRQVKYIEESVGNIRGLTIFHLCGNYILFD